MFVPEVEGGVVFLFKLWVGVGREEFFLQYVWGDFLGGFPKYFIPGKGGAKVFG